MVPHINTVLDGFGLPKIPSLYGPIARDYVAFNAQEENENFASAGDLFDFKTTGAPRARL